MGSIPRSSAALLQRSRVGRKRGFVQILLSLTLAHLHSPLAPRPGPIPSVTVTVTQPVNLTLSGDIDCAAVWHCQPGP